MCCDLTKRETGDSWIVSLRLTATLMSCPLGGGSKQTVNNQTVQSSSGANVCVTVALGCLYQLGFTQPKQGAKRSQKAAAADSCACRRFIHCV